MRLIPSFRHSLSQLFVREGEAPAEPLKPDVVPPAAAARREPRPPITRLLSAVVLAGSAVLTSAADLHAQLPQTRLYSIFPPGAKAGATLDVQVTGGADLDELDALLFNHDGIKAAPKMQDAGGKQQPVPNTFVVTVDAAVPPGVYELRTKGLYGLSNPRAFVVSTREEIQEAEPNNAPEQAAKIALNTVVNGRSNGGADLDWFKFDGKAGQRILVECRASLVDSKMSPTVEVHTAAGRRIGYGRALGRRDPLADVTLPADGEYLVKVHDFIYGGGNEHLYRLRISTEPHVDFVLPQAGQPGSNGPYTLYGRNLPGGEDAGVAIDGRPLQKLTVNIPLPSDPATLQTFDNLPPAEAGIDAAPFVLQTPQGNSNPVLIHLAGSPVVLETEPNDQPAQAQKLAAPCEVAGQFQARGDADHFTFEAKAGEIWFLEVFGERTGSTADPYFVLDQITKNDKGEESAKRITALDDDQTNLAPNNFDTRTDDPVFRFPIPADGTYRIEVRDRYFESRGDPRLIYRLALRREQPDFRLIAFPTAPKQNRGQQGEVYAIGLRKGDNFGLDVLALRRDGFDGVIDVWAEGLPPGVTCKGASLGPGVSSADLIFTAADNAAEWAGHIRVLGKARIDDPAKARAVEAARNAIRPAIEALAKLDDPINKAREASKKANEELTKAKEAAAANTADQNLANQAAEKQKAADAAAAALKKAEEQKAAGAKAVADAEAAAAAAEEQRKAAEREVTREARPGTIVWSQQNGVPVQGRVARSLALSVVKETAPYQVTTDVFRVEANQQRQVLIPVKAVRRNGFDNAIALQFDGLPNNTNIQLDNKPIEKGKDEQLLRLFVNNNAKVGTYTLYLKAQAQVSYRRNPEAAERAKTAQAEAAKAFEDAQAAVKKANEDLNAANQKMNQTAQAFQQADNVKKQAEQKSNAAAQAEKAAAEEAQKAEGDAKAVADQKLAQAQADAKKAAEELAAADKARTDAEAAAKAAEEAKRQAEANVKAANEKQQAAQQAKQQADQAANQANQAANPKNVNLFPPSTPIVIDVKPAPVSLSANIAGGGNVKRGAAVEVKVQVNRLLDFRGPVTLTLPLPPNVAGVSAAPVTIPPDQKEGTLTIQAAGDATEGQLPHMVVRAEMDHHGKAAVDAPINVTVSK